MRAFYNILFNTLLANTANMFVWFALTYWIYLSTRSVLVTSVLAGLYMVFNTASSLFFGGIVDHNKKRYVMILSSILSLLFFVLGLSALLFSETSDLTDRTSITLWIMSSLLLLGTIFGNLRIIALSTLVTILVPPEKRDKANGLVGIVNGLCFSLTAVLSGLAVAFLGMEGSIVVAIIATCIALLHITYAKFDEPEIKREEGSKQELDLRGTIKTIILIPGLVGLLIFNIFNNLLGGVFMSLMDAYGLSMVSVEVWGAIWGVLGFGFILGGIYVSKFGLGKFPLRTMLFANAFAWAAAAIFTVYPSIILMAAGILVWMFISPVVEASEQTVLQKVVPLARQGRVFGFAQSTESAVTPITAFFIGPITELFVIPFMASSVGVAIFGGWFGTEPDRGMALVFTISGLVGLALTLFAFRTASYRKLAAEYGTTKSAEPETNSPHD